MEINKENEKQYTLLLEGLSLEEKSWLYNQAKKQGLRQQDVVLDMIRLSMKGELV